MKTKWLKIFIIIMTIPLFFSFNSLTGKNGETKDSDKRVFIGNWVGEKQIDNAYVTWVQKRLSNGTYTIFLITIEGNKIIRDVETGKWWIKDGKFYEISPNAMTEPDIYDYKIISKDSIMLSNTAFVDKFIDKRVEENYFDSTYINKSAPLGEILK